MNAIPKHTVVPDRGHLDFVAGCPCLLCSGAFYLAPDYHAISRKLSAEQGKKRKSDPHHLPSLIGDRRRTFDLMVIPLCRLHHDWVAGYDGKTWEHRHIFTLIRIAMDLAYYNGRVSYNTMILTKELKDEGLGHAVSLAYQEAAEGYRRQGFEDQAQEENRQRKNRSGKKKVGSGKMQSRKLQGSKPFPKGRKL